MILTPDSALWTDITGLRDFYASSLGQMVQRLVRRRIRMAWPDVRGQRLLGLGFATPFLRPFLSEAERVCALMPSAQGVLPWPPEGPNMTVLADEWDLPLPDRSMDKILVVHALECTSEPRAMLRDVWRVLADGGRLMIVAPNRRGIWARLERTPFGVGRPFSASQLAHLLRETMFTPLTCHGALFVPPSHSRVLLKSAPALENLGDRWFHRFAGVEIIEASKQIYAGGMVAKHHPCRHSYVPLSSGASFCDESRSRLQGK